MKNIPSHRWFLYFLILLSGFVIAAAFVAFNTSYHFLFWPALIIFGIILVAAINKLI